MVKFGHGCRTPMGSFKERRIGYKDPKMDKDGQKWTQRWTKMDTNGHKDGQRWTKMNKNEKWALMG